MQKMLSMIGWKTKGEDCKMENKIKAEDKVSRKEQLKEEIEKKKKSKKGYLDDIETWEEAIDKMKELNTREFVGKFVLVDGQVHFDLYVGNDFFEDEGIPKLLSEN